MQLDKIKIVMNVVLTLFWVRCTFGFISQEMLPFLIGMKSGLLFVLDIMISMVGVLVLKNKWDKIFVGLFLILGYYITCIHNGYGLMFYINGLREFIYMLWLIPIFRYILESEREQEFIKKFDRSLYIFLILQAFCITIQFLKYGANDHGGGTMGNGCSGLVSIMIYLYSFYLMKKRIDPDNFWTSILDNKWLVILLYPTFLNETKISFILLALYFILLMPINKKSFVKMLIIIPIVSVMLFLVFNIYMSATGSEHNIMSSDFIEAYLFAEEDDDIIEWVTVIQERGGDFVGDGSLDIPRFTKYMMIPELNEYYPGHTITGYGIGQFKGGTAIANTKFYLDNEWILRGSIPYGYHAYIQMGFFAVFFFIWLWFRLGSLSKKSNGFHVEYGIIIYVLSITLVIMLYNDFFRYGLLCMPFFYVYIQALRWPSSDIKTINTN